MNTRHALGSRASWRTVAPRLARADRNGWLTTFAVTAVAAALRLPVLGRPDSLVFDETYYVKDAWTLLNLGYESQWPPDPDPAFEQGAVDGYRTEASYVVHPPVGKWVIAVGLRLFGAQDPVGWRFGVALAGLVTVALVTRIGRRLFDSVAAGAVAGLLVALDGSAIVHSRTALLDGVLAMWVVAAFAALLVDRDRGGGSRWRPWRLWAGVLLGLAIGTKWSGLWFLAAFALLSVAWDAAARREPRRWLALRVPSTGLTLGGTAILTYVASWWSWFRNQGGYGRQWAATQPDAWVPDALRSWWHYHSDMWRFHTTLTAEHDYASHPIGWLVQWRPTSFFYATPEPGAASCGADRCSQAVTSLGNPFIWWLGTIAVVAAIWWLLRHRDTLAAALLAPVAAGWLPWFLYPDRPVFTFYAVVILPWLALLITHAGIRLRRWSRRVDREYEVRVALLTVGVVVVATTLFFLPVWNGAVIPFRYWQLHQWLPSWV